MMKVTQKGRWYKDVPQPVPMSPAICQDGVATIFTTARSTAPARASAGLALQAGAVPDHGEIPAFGAAFALITLHARFGDLGAFAGAGGQVDALGGGQGGRGDGGDERARLDRRIGLQCRGTEDRGDRRRHALRIGDIGGAGGTATSGTFNDLQPLVHFASSVQGR